MKKSKLKLDKNSDVLEGFDWGITKGWFRKELVKEFTEYKGTGFHVVRFSKEFGDFVHRYFPELNAQKNNFPALRKIYSLLKETEKRAR